MTTVTQDIRFALRQLRRSPGFAVTAILTLALGIGATTAIFSLVYQVILRSMPVNQPGQLYKIGKSNDCCVTGGQQNDWQLFSTDLYGYLRDHTPSGVSGIAAVDAGADTVGARRPGDTAPQPLNLRYISGNYFSVLGVEPFAGRLITPDDDRESAPPVAVLSYALWQNKFAGDPHLVGSSLTLTGHAVTVVGITAQSFRGERNTGDAAGLWVPLAHQPEFAPDRPLNKLPDSHWLDLLVRIPDAADVSHVQLAFQGELRQWILAHRSLYPDLTDQQLARQTTELLSASGGINDLRSQYERSLKLLLLVAGFVLLIACANLANLMLVRGTARQQELAIRSALGAPRRRLITQMLVESLLLAIVGGASSLLFAYAGTRAILALAMKGVAISPLAASPSLPVLAFAFGLSLVTGVLFGTAPAWIASKANPVQALRGANRSTRDSSALPQKLLVILQAALSLALLSTAGLLITSLRHLEHQNFYFQPQGRLLVSTDLNAAGYTASQLPGLYQRFDSAFAHLPGIQSFAYATYTPMLGEDWRTGVGFPGVPPTDQPEIISYASISPQYFDAVGTRILLGRPFSEHDTASSRHVAVVNQAFVDKYLKGKQPIGEHFGPLRAGTSEYEIVGVAESTVYSDFRNPARPMFFTPMAQTTTFTDPQFISSEASRHFAGFLTVHYQGDPAAAANTVRRTLASIDPNIPILSIRTYADRLSDDFTQQELVVRFTSLFGILALILAAVGLYGVTAYAVARRTSEIGVRMALGSTRLGVLSLILRSALTQAGIGLVLGLPLAFGAGRLLESTLYQTSSFQPLVLLAVVALLLLATVIAAIVPARRAASLDPMHALRTE